MNALARPRVLAPLVLGATLAAWLVTVERMRGMDAGPGTDLGGLGWYLGIWIALDPGSVPGLGEPGGSMQMP